MSDNDQKEHREDVKVQSMVISKTSDGRLTLQAPDDFLLCLGMLEWAKEHLWAAYKESRAQAKAGPKIQVPGMRGPTVVN